MIRETVALTTRELSQEERRIASSSSALYLGNSPGLFHVTSL